MSVAIVNAFSTFVDVITLDTVGTGGRPLSAPVARSRPLAAGILEALGAFRRARCGRARFNLEIRHFTQTGTFGLDALLPVPDVSGAAGTLVAAGLIGALGANGCAFVGAVFAFVNVDTFARADFESFLALAAERTDHIHAVGAGTCRGVLGSFAAIFGGDESINANDTLVDIGTSCSISSISIFAGAFESFRRIQAGGVFVAIVNSERALVPLPADACRFEGALLALAFKSANRVDAFFLVGTVVHSHRAFVNVDAIIRCIKGRKESSHAETLVSRAACWNASLWSSAIVLPTQARIRQLARIPIANKTRLASAVIASFAVLTFGIPVAFIIPPKTLVNILTFVSVSLVSRVTCTFKTWIFVAASGEFMTSGCSIFALIDIVTTRRRHSARSLGTRANSHPVAVGAL